MDEYYTISEKLLSLSKLMRYSIQRTKEPSTLGQELNALASYADLMSMRVSCEVVMDVDVDAELLCEQIPKMILQPMVENAFAHGIPRKEKRFYIHIRGYRSGDYIIIMVRDSGRGIEKEKLDDIRAQLKEGTDMLKSGSIGLTNVNKRLKMQYGANSGVKIYSSHKGTMVCLVIYKGSASAEGGWRV